MPEDKELRMHLQLMKLEHVLDVQENERNNTEFKRNCFFCRMEFEGSHSKLLDHMAFDHNFRFVHTATNINSGTGRLPCFAFWSVQPKPLKLGSMLIPHFKALICGYLL